MNWWLAWWIFALCYSTINLKAVSETATSITELITGIVMMAICSIGLAWVI